MTLRGVMLVRSRTYEVTFTGQAGPVIRAEFDDCTVIVGPSTTTLRAHLPDQGPCGDSCNGSWIWGLSWWTYIS